MPKNPVSILTAAMQAADKKKDETDTPMTEEEMEAFLKRNARKRLLKKAAIATLAGAALTYIAVKLSSTDDAEDTETDVPQD